MVWQMMVEASVGLEAIEWVSMEFKLARSTHMIKSYKLNGLKLNTFQMEIQMCKFNATTQQEVPQIHLFLSINSK